MRRLMSGIGRSLVTVGILTLLFVAYQLWGTGLYTSHQQDRLRSEFEIALHRDGSNPTTTATTSVVTRPDAASTTTTSTTTLTDSAPPPPPIGEAVANLRIPRIGLNSIVVNGTSREDLRKGPGHYPETPLPGQVGNAAIAGHRTTYGAPFGRLDELANGDLIIVRTVSGTFTYEVYQQLVVDPSDVSVLEPDRSHPGILTLTTCTPKYSAAQRLIIHAKIREKPLPAPTVLKPPTKEGLSGQESSKMPLYLAGLIAGLIGLLWWLYFHRHPKLTTWLAGVLPFAVALFLFYSYLERVLPSNY